MIIPVILAAGESQRMGRPKPLLAIQDTTFLDHIMVGLKNAGLPTIKVVLGSGAEDIRRQTGLQESEVVINPAYREGQLTSLQAAIRHLLAEAVTPSAILVCLVDHPLLDRDLISRLVQAFETEDKPIIIPTFRGRRGHPVIFGRAVFPELLEAPPDQGAKAVVRRRPERVFELETGDDSILIDIDTPEQYLELRRRLK